jgi:threonine dehydrogenase-like Zn-dependent dehydrogenase
VVKVKGTVVNVAIWEKEIPFNPNWVTWKESTFKSVLGYQKEDFQAVVESLGTGKWPFVKARTVTLTGTWYRRHQAGGHDHEEDQARERCR